MTRTEAKRCGKKRYFTGLECVNGHIDLRRVDNGNCISCIAATNRRTKLNHPKVVNARKRAWEAANPARVRAAANARRQANPEMARAKEAAWLALNRESVRARQIARRAANLEAEKVKSRAYYHANRAKARIINAAWQKANRDKCNTYVRNRDARKAAAGGTHTAADVHRIGDLQKWRCAWCRVKCGDNYHVDHIVPIALGGSNSPSNLCIACPTCNLRKKDAHPIAFAQRLGMLL